MLTVRFLVSQRARYTNVFRSDIIVPLWRYRKNWPTGIPTATTELWPDDERWELIDGVAWNMSPAPSPGHQSVLLSLIRKIADITDRTGCTTFIAPFDVRLPDNAAQSGGRHPNGGSAGYLRLL